jgi:hypothetical protein
VRSTQHQRYCSKRCYRTAKRERDCEHKRLYRDTGLGREQRRRENQRLRERLGWTEYMRYWRKADPVRTARQERKRAHRYYQKHGVRIREKRRQQYVARKRLRKASSH